MYYLKYILVGYKLDETIDRVCDIEVLDYSDEEIIIDDELKEIYHYFNILKVYEEKIEI